ncbi:MAG: signal recognition particle receptor subunit alpha, partial [Phycisphaeraceae bacterium]|nr:signal recognition particle receptor subunit alpha [Phycisphaeraceae bacterium]
MFENLTDKFSDAFRKLSGRGRISESNITEAMDDVRTALLEADVHYEVVDSFIAKVSQLAMGTQVLSSLKPAQLMIKIVNDELVDLMGPVDHTIPPAGKNPTVIMMVGLQGAGKTTTTGKLAKLATKKGRKPLLVAADMIRPAAVEQLKTLGEQQKLPVYFEKSG